MTEQFITKLFYEESDPVVFRFRLPVVPKRGERLFIKELAHHGAAKVKRVVHVLGKNADNATKMELHLYLSSDKLS